jgi:hypothetical protein
MLRTRLVLSAFFGVLPASLCAQFDMSLSGGVHVDRSSEHDRLVTERGAYMLAEQGEASAFGIRLGYWRHPQLGFQFDLSRSSNSSWSGSTPLPPPSFANRTTYLSARAMIRTSPEKLFQFGLAGGPAVMIYSGTGTNLRSRGADVGGVLEASARLRIVHQLAFEVAISNYLYNSTYVPVPEVGQATGRSVFRTDVLLMPGLVYSW